MFGLLIRPIWKWQVRGTQGSEEKAVGVKDIAPCHFLSLEAALLRPQEASQQRSCGEAKRRDWLGGRSTRALGTVGMWVRVWRGSCAESVHTALAQFPAPAVAIHKMKGKKESPTDLPLHGGPRETYLNRGRRAKVAKVALDNGSWVSSLCQGEGIFPRLIQCF